MPDWYEKMRRIRPEEVRFVVLVHVDGRRMEGRFQGIVETPNGPQVVIQARSGEEIRLFVPSIRSASL